MICLISPRLVSRESISLLDICRRCFRHGASANESEFKGSPVKVIKFSKVGWDSHFGIDCDPAPASVWPSNKVSTFRGLVSWAKIKSIAGAFNW